MNKKILWTIVIILIALAAWIWRSQLKEAVNRLPQPAAPAEDTTGQINQSLQKIDLGDVNKEFESIDAELNNL